MKRLAILALAAASLVPFAACGDDEPATDEEFVSALCGARVELDAGLTSALAAAENQTEPVAALEELVEPLEGFVESFRDTDPPEDLAAWHKSAGETLESAVERFKDDQSLASLEGFGDSPIPDPPAEAKKRLREVAEGLDECQGVALFKPD